MRKACCCILFIAFAVNLDAREITGIYKRYTGQINKKLLVTADLMITDSLLVGYYYYNKAGVQIELSGIRKKDMINLTEHHDTVTGGYFTGTISSDLAVIDGTWSDASHSRSFPFHLEAFLPEGSAELHSLSESLTYIWRKNNKGDAFGCTAYYTYCFVSDMTNKEAQKKINELLIDTELDENESIMDTKKIAMETMSDNFDSFIESYDEVYVNEVSEEDKKYMDESPSAYSWDQQAIMGVLYNENNLLCIRQQMYQYTGGAHGNYGYGFQIFDLRSGEALALENLFKPGYRTELTAITEQQLRKNYGINSTASLGNAGFLVEKLELNDNYYIKKDGIGFIYNPYEIASYADGAIDIFLKWDQVQSLIDPDGPLSQLLK